METVDNADMAAVLKRGERPTGPFHMLILVCLFGGFVATPILNAQTGQPPSSEVIDSLRRGLSCPDVQVRSATLRLLRKDKRTKFAKSLVPDIVRLLRRESHPFLRREGVRTLVDLATPEAKNALLSLISSPDSAIRLEVVKGLGQVGDHTSLPQMTRLLSDPQPSVRRETARQMARIADRNRRGVPSPIVTSK